MRAAVGLCKETAANSGIFEREWTKANISMDCNSWTPTITMKLLNQSRRR